MKKLIPAYIISFVISFMFFIYEPVTMYATNVDDFWFDLSQLFSSTIVLFLISFVTISLIYTLIYLINKKLSTKLYVYNFIIIISFIIFLCLYIQGNYLIGNLPPLDGTSINWNNYKAENIISLVIFILIILIELVVCKKFSLEKNVKLCGYVTLAVFAMLTVSLCTSLATKDVFISKKSLSITEKNINTASNNKNFFMLVVDAVDSVEFEKVLTTHKQYKDTFNDFTYYKDTLSTYAFTRDSMPFILSGIWNENQSSYNDYYNNAMDNSILLNRLKEDKYSINIYDTEFAWNDKQVSIVENINFGLEKMDLIKLAKQELKYDLFKYLPYSLKKYSKIGNMNFALCRMNENNEDKEYYDWGNYYFYSLVKNSQMEIKDNNYFNLVHIEGGHVPFYLDDELNVIENGTYQQKLASTLKTIDAYIKRLKENNVYDNSVIIIMADHGYNHNSDDILDRFNPLLLIKGINEHHKMSKSDISVSFEDLNAAYMQLLNGESSDKLFQNIDSERNRRLLWYEYTKENHMVEYKQTGKAWDKSTLTKTGKVYDR